ncbi:MAG: pyridoxine 5'-phosphate synthase [Elusimicrobia bacterium RIFOXYB2_FULL_48_7]|nr:MAG: pyridoxine 5'-phosphate synthase [Elusimicrobia bacterium RIFOXYB2_FULL_48_7]
MVRLGVNIDHVATLRQARKAGFPDLLQAARACESAGADSITVHLREDRRHIQDADVSLLRKKLKVPLNLEMSVAEDIVRFALKTRPAEACIVPEKRQELTTEGGLDVSSNKEKIRKVVARLKSSGIIVSLFIDPEIKQVESAAEVAADCVELHTGAYASYCARKDKKNTAREILKIRTAGKLAASLGLRFNAGHGLDYSNTGPVAGLPAMHTLNIGFSVIARAVFTGLSPAVKEMKRLIRKSERN